MGMTMSGSGSYYVIYKVVGTEGQEYRVELTGGMEMILDVDIGGSYMGETVSGSMHMTMVAKMNGNCYFTKNEIAQTRADAKVDLDMEVSGKVAGQSFEGSMDITADMHITYNPPLDLFDFPIEVGESWNAVSNVTVTGSMSGTMDIPGLGKQSISKSLDQTVYVSLSVSCPTTVDIPLASTCYKIVVGGMGMEQASLFMPAYVLYYSPDRGFIVASEVDLGEAMRGAMLKSGEEMGAFAGGITGITGTIKLNSVTEQEARDAIARMGAKGIPIILIAGIAAIVIVAIIAVLVVRRRRAIGI